MLQHCSNTPNVLPIDPLLPMSYTDIRNGHTVRLVYVLGMPFMRPLVKATLSSAFLPNGTLVGGQSAVMTTSAQV